MAQVVEESLYDLWRRDDVRSISSASASQREFRRVGLSPTRVVFPS